MGTDDTIVERVSPLAAISSEIRSILESTLPEISWKEGILGASIPAVPSGTISADEIRFESRTKIDGLATISFLIYLIIPDSVSRSVEADAMTIRRALSNESDLSGLAWNSEIKKITFGIAPGIPGRTAGAAVLQYDVTAYL